MQASLRLTFDPVNPKTIQLPINPQGFVFLGAVMLELLTRNYFQSVGPCLLDPKDKYKRVHLLIMPYHPVYF